MRRPGSAGGVRFITEVMIPCCEARRLLLFLLRDCAAWRSSFCKLLNPYGGDDMGPICQRCKRELPDGSKFCCNCGRPVPAAACPKCGFSNLSPVMKFCPMCGAPLTGQALHMGSPCQDNDHFVVPFPAGRSASDHNRFFRIETCWMRCFPEMAQGTKCVTAAETRPGMFS